MKRYAMIQVATALGCLLAFSSVGCATERPAGTSPPGMALVPAGAFTPHFRGETEPNAVAVPAFFLDAFTATNDDFLAGVGDQSKGRRSQVKLLVAEEH